LLVTVNNRLKFEIEIVHDLSCHPIDELAAFNQTSLQSTYNNSNCFMVIT